MAVVPVQPVDKYPPYPPEPFTEPPPVVTTSCEGLPAPYYLEDGLRKVRPYHYTYNTSCKERWRGREILDVFGSEFRDREVSYYEDAIKRGVIVLNGKPVTTTTIIKNGDIISHTLHRHEPPVSGKPVAVVHEDNDFIVINKPAGVPVHPAGRYNHNSVVEIMRAERGYSFNPMPCHRLDRLTSGVMFIGKHREAAERLGKQIRDRSVKKEYVARVIGEFPEGDITCEQPILQINPKLGLNRVRANGKDARTVFKRLAYYPPKDGEVKRDGLDVKDGMAWKNLRGYSIVRCMPLTGRTHQLRVHLQYLGHPISNDPIYCNQRVFGPSLGRGAADEEDEEDIITRLSRMGKQEVAEAVAYHDEMVDEYNKRKAEKMTGELCDVCQTPLYSDPGPHELGIFLHAKRYYCEEGGWDYSTELPEWALPPPGMDGPTEATPETDPLALDLKKLGLEDDGEVVNGAAGTGNTLVAPVAAAA